MYRTRELHACNPMVVAPPWIPRHCRVPACTRRY
jgi:hypothetical protein